MKIPWLYLKKRSSLESKTSLGESNTCISLFTRHNGIHFYASYVLWSFLSVQTQLVEPSFQDGAHTLDKERGIKILYGMVRGQDPSDGDQDEDGLLQENPTLVPMEFARLMGFRPMDLLSTFDKDKSNSLDKDEIKMGLRVRSYLYM